MRRQAAAAAAGAPTYAYIEKTTNQTITTGTSTKLTAYDSSFTNDTVNFSFSLANGDIFILKSGIYALYWHLIWTATFTGFTQAFTNSGTIFLGLPAFWVGKTREDVNPLQTTTMGGSGLGLCEDPGVNPGVNSDNSIQVIQNSGADRIIDRAHLAIVRLGDFS